MFQQIPAYPGDPILTLAEDFQKDARAVKANLGIGVYCDAAGKVPVLESVRQARQKLAAQASSAPCTYLPMEGFAPYRQAACELAFGTEGARRYGEAIATIQTPGGSGALKVGADFLHRYFPSAKLWISDPSWDNHRSIFEGAGVTVGTYPYYDARSGGVDFAAMKSALAALPAGDIVLLHPCCHNPTGADLLPAQWDELLALLRARGLLPFLDLAYQGFAEGLDEDAYAPRAFAAAGLPFVLSQSFSKNFSLYGERCGALHIFCADAAQMQNVLGQLKFTVRRIYSSPPRTGAEIVAAVLTDTGLAAQWRDEVAAMRSRMQEMRQALRQALSQRAPKRDFAFLERQRGMFSYSGLSPEQVQSLREQHAIYLVRSGRLCVAGLNPGNVESVATAIAALLA